MTIRTRLMLGAIICIGLASFLAAFLILTARQVSEANEENTLAGKLAEGISELQILTSDYVLQYESRAETQWYQKHDSIKELLVVGENTEGKVIYDSISQQHEHIKNSFTQLTMLTKEKQRPGSEGTGLYEELENRLMGQLLIKLQMMGSDAHELQLLTQTKLDAAQRRIIFSVIGFASVVGAVIAVVILWIRRSVLSPLGKVQAGTEIIGSGELDYRLGLTTRDEIGQLARAFDDMTEKLQTTTVSRDKLAEDIVESEEQYRSIVNLSGEVGEAIIMLQDTDQGEGIQTFVSDEWSHITGYSHEELIDGSFFNLVHPKDREASQERYQRRIKGEVIPGLFEITIIRKDGTEVPVELISAHTAYRERHANVLYIRDVTERKKTEEIIKASLAEKELLLKEVHHRVKNNMQVISSLLKLGAASIKNKEDALVFKDSQAQIKSMALVYNKLYQAEDLAHIDFREYVRELVSGLVHSYKAVSGKVTTSVEGGDVSLGVDQAIPCGLVINELITNSLKYAFPKGRGGEIRVSLGKSEDEVELAVSDDGVGIPASLDLANSKTLGLHLVGNLVEQLGGKIELDRTAGTRFRITFRKNQE